MATIPESRKIMTKPLPQILDEIEDSIGLADEAAKNAREAAAEARKAGEKAIEAAIKITNDRIAKTNEHIARVEQLTEESFKRINEHFARTDEHIDKVELIARNALQLAELLKSALSDAMMAVDKKITDKIEVKPSPRANK